ncbi:transcriptional regulator [Celeribacter halophilus]|uniref:Transcriptional regulator n=1 Tax=Celeribacter halophilus TaxID=576117 RepID=A0AAW7XXQ2_9RHOB|nr:transcriptional regulator [Celeribacter halophilus]MDO6458043.1 transcriptional regulator [Celeribacter halophilus]
MVNKHKRISASKVRELCGGVTNMTLWRWQRREDLNFPAPTMIGQRRYWKESDIIAWLDAQVASEAEAHA